MTKLVQNFFPVNKGRLATYSTGKGHEGWIPVKNLEGLK